MILRPLELDLKQIVEFQVIQWGDMTLMWLYCNQVYIPMKILCYEKNHSCLNGYDCSFFIHSFIYISIAIIYLFGILVKHAYDFIFLSHGKFLS